MNAGNWEKLEDIFHAAVGLPFGERQPFLARECGGDRELISEVESLLENFEGKPEFLDAPVFELGLGAIHRSTEKNLAGSTIGVYEIKEKIGAGGMGEIYKPFDTNLNRTVALKFLPESLKNDAAAKRRLAREAQAAAALEHPNICTVHGFEQTDEHHFIVMQCVEGKTLSERYKETCVGVEEFKSLARQIFTAVAFAHAHGVVHRDLKPGNIMVTEDRRIKILDFGLAKIDPAKQLTNGNGAEELSRFSTNGLIVGTIAYMSPEQLRGEKLDYRSDIFSVGVILYKLITGKNPFHRASQAETIAAILSENTGMAEMLKEIAPEFPENLFKIVERCLHKERDARFGSAAEVLVELDNAENPQQIRAFAKRRSFLLKTAFAAVLVLAFLAVVFLLETRRPQRTLAVLPIKFENPLPEKEYLADDLTISVIDKLSNLSDLKVKNESLVAGFKVKTIEPREAGRQLKVDAVYVGIIKNRADGMILESRIVRTSDGAIIDSVETKIDELNLVGLPENIASRILAKVESRLTDEDRKKLTQKDTESNEAKNQYLQGRFYLKRRKDGDDVERAVQAFTTAKDIDQNYARAWAGLADAYLAQSTPGVKRAITPQQSVELAKKAANKALELDDTLSESYTSLGLISSRYDWNWREAEDYFRTAINLDPEFLPARFGLIRVLSNQERNEEALEEAHKVKEYDPFSVGSDIQIALAYYRKRDYEQTEKILSDLIQRFPDDMRIKYAQVYQLLKTNRPKEAAEMIEPLYKSAREEDRVLAAAPLGLAFAKMGRRDEALDIIKDLQKIRRRIYVPAQEDALIYVGLGDYDKAFESLRQSCSEKFSSLPNWITDPIVDEVKSDARFAEIKKCVNL